MGGRRGVREGPSGSCLGRKADARVCKPLSVPLALARTRSSHRGGGFASVCEGTTPSAVGGTDHVVLCAPSASQSANKRTSEHIRLNPLRITRSTLKRMRPCS